MGTLVSQRVDDCCAVGLPPYNPPGGTPAGPPAFCKSKDGGGLGDTSPERVRARGPLAQRVYAAVRPRPRLHASMQQIAAAAALTITAVISSCTPAGAAGSGMPWESPLTRILESIEGPVAKVCAVVIIIVTGLSLAFGDMSGGFRRLVQVVFGLSIAFAATSFFLSFFSFAGGALID
jgi:type IV secretory pathway VirB2 component (pilin)